MSVLLTSEEGGILTLTLNRPDNLNAFNEDLHSALREALQHAAQAPQVRTVILTGAGRAFSAGQDLSSHTEPDAMPDLGDTLERLYNPLVRQIVDLEKPVLCAVNGVAAGAACNIALACDIVIAAHSAIFLQPFTTIGLVPDAGGTWTLPRLVGPARAKALMMLSEKLPASLAEEWGLIWKAVPDEELSTVVGDLAHKFAKGPTLSYAAIKKALAMSADHSLQEQLDLERDLQRTLGQSEDHREGVAAFLEKRPPVYKGH